jgi:hypothetical protein
MLDFRQVCVLFFLIEGVIYFLLRGSDALFPVLFLVLFAYLVLFFFSMRLTSNFYLKAKNNAKKGCVVLGFDDS